MKSKTNELAEMLSNYISKKNLYYASALAKISVMIIKKRSEMGMNQKEFAKFMNVSQGMISKWESTEYNFTIEAISEICEKLNMSFDVELKSEQSYYESRNKDKYTINADTTYVSNHKWTSILDYAA